MCDRPHDEASCKKAYADNEYFKGRVDSYGETAKANGNKVPTKEQLQDSTIRPSYRVGLYPLLHAHRRLSLLLVSFPRREREQFGSPNGTCTRGHF